MLPSRPLLPRCTDHRWPRLRAWLVAGWLASAGLAQAATGDCNVQWQVQPRLDTTPPSLDVRMSFDGAGRSRTSLRLPAGWSDVAETGPEDAARLQPVPGDMQLRQVRHQPGERVQLQWRLTPKGDANSAGPMLMARWFAFSGDSVLPWPEELAAQASTPVCIDLTAPEGVPRLVSSFGAVQAPQAHWAVNSGAAVLQRSLFAGGALQWRESQAAGQALTVAMPEDAAASFTIDALSDASVAAVASLRKGWSPADAAPLLVMVVPGRGLGGAALHQAMAMQLPATLAVPGPAFDELLAMQWLRVWLADRLGPLAYLGRGDAPLRAWFNEGFADFLAHRWLLREGHWTPEVFAEALNRKIARYQSLPENDADNLRVVTGRAGPEAATELPAARGEWLALHWHQALRRAGQPGLDAVLRALVVPAAQARREGPLSSPLATQRMLATLRQALGDAPLRELTRHIDEGAVFAFTAQTLGPCFQPAIEGSNTAPYRAVDKALERSDCTAWLQGGGATGRERELAGAAAAAGAAGAAAGSNPADPDSRPAPAPPPATRTVCTTVPAPKPVRGKPAAKPKTVCRTVAAAPPAANAAAARPGARAAAPARPAARPPARPAAKPVAKPATKPPAKPAAKPPAAR